MPKNDTLRDQPAVAAGWVMVPVEPTGVMKDCGAGSLPLAAAKPWAAGDCYRAMLAAAPQPAATAGAVDAKTVSKLAMADEYQRWIDHFHKGWSYDDFLRVELAAQRGGA